MSNYRETTADGTAYTRARTVIIHNDLEHKAIEFQEEDIASIGGKVVRERGEAVVEGFDESNVATTFPILDADGIDTGTTASYMEVYGLLHSLYIHLATARDADVAAAVAEREDAVARAHAHPTYEGEDI